MNNGIFGSISAGLQAERRLEVLTHNLANVNTPGYKKDLVSFEAVLGSTGSTGTPEGVVPSAPVYKEKYSVDFSAGQVKLTGNTLDLALDGDGFFVVNTPDGKAYTRQGNFHLDRTGKLLTADGFEVMGQGGPITIKGSSVTFDSQGKIFVEGQETGSLQVVDFPRPYDLRKKGNGLLMPNDPALTSSPAVKTVVRQSHLESSNVNTIEEMTRMITITRSSETYEKVIQNYDSIIGRAVNDLGKV
jgi:flagellar basal-body rod protein FlgG